MLIHRIHSIYKMSAEYAANPAKDGHIPISEDAVNRELHKELYGQFQSQILCKKGFSFLFSSSNDEICMTQFSGIGIFVVSQPTEVRAAIF